MAEAKRQLQLLRFGDFEVDLRTGELRKAGSRLKFGGQPFQVLSILLERPGDLVTREELQKRLWPDTFVDVDHNLNTAINKIREVLGDSAESPRFIETLSRRGYRFIGELEPPAPDAAPAGSHGNGNPSQMRLETAAPSPAQAGNVAYGETRKEKSKADSRKRFLRWLPGTAVLAAGLAFLFWYLHRPLPPPRISGYVQITHDGHQKAIAGTDGSRLYFNLWAPSSMAQVAISGGEIAPVTVAIPGADPWLSDVSPDGSNILIESAHEWNYAAGRTLWNVRLLGGSYRSLGHAISEAFSPDGISVAYFTAEGDLWIVRSDGTGAHKVATVGEGVADLAWSPDGETIRFTRHNLLWEITSSGSGLHQLLPGWHASCQQSGGQWTPDGKAFLFACGDAAQGDQIWALDERRGLLRRPPADAVQLTTGPIHWDSPVPGKAGKKIFAVGWIPHGELARFDLKTKQFQPFLGGISAESVSFSKDGQKLAYVSYPGGILWRANRDGSNPVQLSDPPMYAVWSCWSPDGTQILFTDFSPRGAESYIVSSQGGAPRRLLPEDTEEHWDPNWSPGGDKIVFESGPRDDPKKNYLGILDLASQKVTVVPGSVGLYSPRWSPDARYLAALSWSTPPYMRIFDFQTQRWSALATVGLVGIFSYPIWSTDSQFVYFMDLSPENRGAFRVRAKGGEAERVADLEGFHLAGRFGSWLGLDPTDAPLILRDVGSNDIYALTLEEK